MTNSTSAVADSGLSSLPPEPWGRKLIRAREDVADLTLAQAAKLAGHWMLTTDSTISRLEAQKELPTGGRNRGRRQLAYVLCLAYGVDPAEFGLGPDDLQLAVSIPPRTTGEQGKASTIWFAPKAA